MSIVTRFAPSPTGRLHAGNLRTALFNWCLARGAGGRFLLRSEDTDVAREGEGDLERQLADLAWCGLDWDGGPDRPAPEGPFRQSERGGLYREYLGRLAETGRAYACYRTEAELKQRRAELRRRGVAPRYDRTWAELPHAEVVRRRNEGQMPVIRFASPETGEITWDDLVKGPRSLPATEVADFILTRSDGSPGFLFANTVDDALMGVTHVLRGEDHLANTPRQRLLLEALGLPPPAYGHLPLLVGPDGAPLSKRAGATSVGALRARGFLPGAVSNYLLRLGHAGAADGWVEPAALAGQFALQRVGRAPAHYDEGQLIHWQREAVKSLDDAACAAWLAPALPTQLDARQRARLAQLLRHNVVFPDDVRPWVDVLFGELPPPDAVARAILREAGAAFFAAAVDALAATGPDLVALARELRLRTGQKGAALYRPLRVALTGRQDGPELGPLLAALPAEVIRSRLAAAGEPTGEQA
jgi:nondiscriminating glutamyl-tRNA synthetase